MTYYTWYPGFCIGQLIWQSRIRQELDSARNQAQARQSELSAAGRELDAAQNKVREARAEAKQAREEAAELRGKLAASAQNKPVTKTKNITTNSAEDWFIF